MAHQEIRITGGKAGQITTLQGEAHYGVHATRFGHCLIAVSSHGIIALDFRDAAAELQPSVVMLAQRWPQLAFRRDDAASAGIARDMESHGADHCARTLPLHLKGTPFQLRVWQALLTVPEGDTSDYSRIARAIGASKAVRAVGQANGANPIAFLVPCHRILAKNGSLGGYATGLARKEAMLAFERQRRRQAA